MADKEEKIIPEAEEAKVEETAAPAEEKKVEAPKKETKAKKMGKGGLTAIIIVAAVLVVALAAFLILGFVSGNNAVASYQLAESLRTQKADGYEAEYEKAYESSKLAFFMSQGDKNTIFQQYIIEVLCNRDQKYYKAAQLLEASKLTDAEKNLIYASHSKLGLCKAGTVVKYGVFKQEKAKSNEEVAEATPLEWIVLDVKEVNGRIQATLITKDVIAAPGAFADYKTEGNNYKGSALEKYYSQTFVNEFNLANDNLGQDSFVNVTLEVGGGSITTKAYPPSAEEIAKLKEMKAEYVTAAPSAVAKAAGARPTGGFAHYYLRDAGENGCASYVDPKGEVKKDLGLTSEITGARVCVVVDLGAAS